MDIRQIDEADPRVSLDLLREWISTACRRSVGETVPSGCPWSSLVVALQHAGLAGSVEDLERQLRQHLVDTYLAQSKEGIVAAIRAKMGCGGAFVQLLGPDPEKVGPRWPWYIYCLSIATFDPLEDWAVRVPLDMVDLQVLAIRLKVSIFVSQLLQQALRFQPTETAQCSIHLVQHRGQWAPVLGLRAPEKEAARLVDTVVELHRDVWEELPENMQSGSSCHAGCVLEYVRERDEYLVDLGRRRVWVDRSHILRVLCNVHQEERAEGGLEQAEAPGEMTPLGGIPERSLEWQILHELVRREARRKLEHMMQQLAGRETVSSLAARQALCGIPEGKDLVPEKVDGREVVPPRSLPRHFAVEDGMRPENPQDVSHAQRFPWDLFDPGPLVCLRLSFDVMVERVREGCEISVYAVRPFAPAERGLLALSVGDEVQIIEVGNRWVYVVQRLLRGAGQDLPGHLREGWCPRDCLTIWEARQQFRPDERCEKGRFLALEVGDTVVLTRRYAGTWDSWGHGTRWGEKMGSGTFSLGHVEPQVLVKRWTWEI